MVIKDIALLDDRSCSLASRVLPVPEICVIAVLDVPLPTHPFEKNVD